MLVHSCSSRAIGLCAWSLTLGACGETSTGANASPAAFQTDRASYTLEVANGIHVAIPVSFRNMSAKATFLGSCGGIPQPAVERRDEKGWANSFSMFCPGMDIGVVVVGPGARIDFVVDLVSPGTVPRWDVEPLPAEFRLVLSSWEDSERRGLLPLNERISNAFVLRR